MAHKNLGRKRRCASCGIKFYDLTKTPAICPACGTEFDPEVLLKSRRGRAAAKVDEAKTPPKEEDVNEDDVVEKAENDEFENDDDEMLASESDLISISADDDDEETGSSRVELIDVLDDDLDDAAGSDDE